MPKKTAAGRSYVVFISHSHNDRLTKNSIERPWVLIEIGAAWALEKRIVAIIDKVTPQEMPDIIAPYKAIDLNDLDDYLEQLIGRAKGAAK
jgi:hypothetical protein